MATNGILNLPSQEFYLSASPNYGEGNLANLLEEEKKKRQKSAINIKICALLKSEAIFFHCDTHGGLFLQVADNRCI